MATTMGSGADRQRGEGQHRLSAQLAARSDAGSVKERRHCGAGTLQESPDAPRAGLSGAGA